MAIYRCEIKTISRSQGASAVAGAAYRAGIDLTDERTGEHHNYSHKSGVLAFEVLAPASAPEWVRDPAQLWNAAEAAETRKNSVVAREFLISLPHELNADQRIDLARELTANLVNRFGFAAMFALHAPDKRADERNHHVHILATTRRMEPTGLGAKTRELDDRKTGAVDQVRAQVAATINRHLEHAGLAERVDHRSLLDRQVAAANAGDFAQVAALDRSPEPKVGRTATAAARRGKRSPRAERVQRVRVENAQHAQAQADRFRELKARAAAEGRLQPAGEQALHARALLERRQESALRLQAAAVTELRAIDQSQARRAAVQARAKKPHKGVASKPRPPAGADGQPGKVSAALERAARSKDRTHLEEVVMKEAAKQLEELIEELIARAKRSLQQPDTLSPWQRSTARQVLTTHSNAEDRKADFFLAKTHRDDAVRTCRRTEADANHFQPGTDVGSRMARLIGRPSERDRQAKDAVDRHREAQNEYQRSRRLRDDAKKAWEAAVRDAEKAREDFAQAFNIPAPKFPKVEDVPQLPEVKPALQVPTPPTRPRPPGLR
ncbi:MAG: MobA/MobL family protein [Xanthomonadales bacterium]|nr:MobA/MobL family protein [Xanthomonadales bacterium]